MKLFACLLSLCCGLTLAQFGGFGGFGNLNGLGSNFAKTVQTGFNNLTSYVPKVPTLDNVKSFADFAQQSGKKYLSAAEQKLREGIFVAHKQLVDANNAAYAAGKSTYEMVTNAFADIPFEEFVKHFTGNRKSSQGEKFVMEHRQKAAPEDKPIPKSFDWREKGGVTPVKFQGDCGSCWSFATTGAIEGHVFRKTGKLVDLSEQNLVDCGKLEYGLNGCDGGFQEYAFEFVSKQQKGIAKDEHYPYVDKKQSCSYKNNIKGSEISGFATVDPKDEETMKKVVATLGPLACSINGLESLLLYKRGIYADEECNKGEVNHSVLVVGYGSENGQDYWIVKNSWDQAWGEEGYFRLPRGKNYCGIASECSYPIV